MSEGPPEPATDPLAPDPSASADAEPASKKKGKATKNKGKKRAWGRIAFRVGCGLGLLGVVASAALCGVGGWLLTPGGQSRLAREVEGLVGGFMAEGELKIGRLKTDLLSQVLVEDVKLLDGSGRTVVAVERASAKLDLTQLPAMVVAVPTLDVQGVDADLQVDDAGNLDLARMFAQEVDPNAAPFEGLPVDVVFSDIKVRESRVRFTAPGMDPVVVEEIDLGASFSGSGMRFDVQDIDLSGEMKGPLAGPLAAAGEFTWEGSGVDKVDLDLSLRDNVASVRGFARALGESTEAVDLDLEVAHLDLPDIDAFVDVGLDGQVGGFVSARGSLSALELKGTLSGKGESRGKIDVDAKADVYEPSWEGQVDVVGLQVDDYIQAITDPLPVTVSARVSGSGAQWPDTVKVQAEILDAKTEVFGVAVERASGNVGLEGGLVRATDLDVGGPTGDVTGSATFDVESGALTLDLHGEDIDPSTLRELYVPAELDGGRATADVKVEVQTYAEVVDVRVDGTGDISPFRWTESIRARTIKGDFNVRVRGTDVDVAANARGSGIVAYGAEIERATSRDIQVYVRETAVDVTGNVDASNAVYPLIPVSMVNELGRGVEAESGTGTYTVHVPLAEDSGDAFTVDVDLDLGAHKLLRYPGTDGVLTVGIVDNALSLVTKLDASSTRRLADVDMALDLETLRFRFPVLQVAPEPRQSWTAIPGGGFVATESGVEDLDLTLRSARGEIEVQGEFSIDGDLGLDVEIYDLHLLAVARLLPMWLDGLDGYAGGVIALKGTADAPILSAELEAADISYEVEGEDGRYAAVQRVGGRLSVNGEGGGLRVDGVVDVDGMPIADLDITTPITLAFDRAGLEPEGPLDATVVLPKGGLTRFGDMLGMELVDSAAIGATLSLTGTPLEPVGQLVADGTLPVPGLADDIQVDAKIEKLAGARLKWTATAREGDLRRANLTGEGRTSIDKIWAYYLEAGRPEPKWSRPSFYLKDLASFLKLYGLPVRSIVQAAQLDLDVEGAINGSFAVTGSAAKPRVDGDLVLTRGRAATVNVSDFKASLRSSDKGYTVAASGDLEQDLGRQQTGELGSIFVDGTVPLVVDLTQEYKDWARGDLDIAMDVDVPIALLSAYDPGVRDATGFLEIDGSVQGPVFDPAPGISLRTSNDVSLIYRPIGVRFREVMVDVVIDRHAIDVRGVSAQTRPSRVRVDTALTGALSSAFRGGGEAVDEVGGLFRRKKNKEDKKDKQPKVQRGSLSAKGTATLTEWAVEKLDLSMTLEQALFLGTTDQQLRLSTQGPLTVQGPLAQPVVRGKVEVDEANVFLDYASAMGGSAKTLDPRINVIRGGVSTQTEEAEASVFDDMDIELAIDLGRASRGRLIMPLEAIQWLGTAAEKILQVDARARLETAEDLRFRQVPCRVRKADGTMKLMPGRDGACGLYHPQVTGIVGIVDGTARVLRADFTLSESSVRFLGSEVYNPNLDIHGKMEASDTTITMDIGGTAYDPDIEFSSPDSDQVFATLALGTSLDGLTAQQVASAVGMALLNTALGDVNLPSVSIDPRGKIQVGLAVGSSIFVEFTAGGTPRPDENVFEGEVEYTLARGVLVRAGFGAYAIPFWSDFLLQRKFD